jgi:hypothetical protein
VLAEHLGDVAGRLTRHLTDESDHQPLRAGHADARHHPLRSHIERMHEIPHPLHELQRFACRL